MRLQVVLRPEAILDAEETQNYLEGQQSGLGPVFLDCLNELLIRIATSPHLQSCTRLSGKMCVLVDFANFRMLSIIESIRRRRSVDN